MQSKIRLWRKLAEMKSDYLWQKWNSLAPKCLTLRVLGLMLSALGDIIKVSAEYEALPTWVSSMPVIKDVLKKHTCL